MNELPRSIYIPKHVALAFLSFLFILLMPLKGQEGSIETIKEHFRKKEFVEVIKVFNSMNRDNPAYLSNEMQILTMVARAMGESRYKDVEGKSEKLQSVFYRMLEKNHSLTSSDLEEPENNPEFYLDNFNNVYAKSFGRLRVEINREGANISVFEIGRSSPISSAQTTGKYSPILFRLWVGNTGSRRYTIEVQYKAEDWGERKEYERQIRSNETEVLEVDFISPFVDYRENFISFSGKQTYLNFSERFFEQNINYVEPSKDFTSFELGFGFRGKYYAKISYGKNFGFLEKEDKWYGISDYSTGDYDIVDICFSVDIAPFYRNRGPYGVSLGYRKFKVDHISFEDNINTTDLGLFTGGIFFRERPRKRNTVFTNIKLLAVIGSGTIEYVNLFEEKIAPSVNSLGVSISGEVGYSFNMTFDFGFEVSYDYFENSIEEEGAQDNFLYRYGYLQVEQKAENTIEIFQIAVKLTIRI